MREDILADFLDVLQITSKKMKYIIYNLNLVTAF